MTGSDNTPARVECRDCVFCQGANWRGGTCTHADSGYTHTFVHAGVEFTILDEVAPVPQSIFGYPVVIDPMLETPEVRVGPPLIQQAVGPGLKDFLAKYGNNPDLNREIFSSEAFERVEPSDEGMGGYLIPATISNNLLEQLRKLPARRNRSILYGTEGKVSIGFRKPGEEDMSWMDLPIGTKVEMDFDPALPGSERTVYQTFPRTTVTWEVSPVTEEDLAWAKPSERTPVPPTPDEMSELREWIKQNFIKYMQERIDHQFLYGNSDAPKRSADWEGTWHSLGDLIGNIKDRYQGRPVEPEEPLVYTLSHVRPEHNYVVNELSDLYTNRMPSHYRSVGFMSVRHDSREFRELVRAQYDNKPVQVQYKGKLYQALVVEVEHAETRIDRGYPAEYYYQAKFLLDGSPDDMRGVLHPFP